MLRAAVAPDRVAEHRRRLDPGLAGAVDGVDRLRLELVAALDQARPAPRPAPGPRLTDSLGPVEGDHVPAQIDVAVEARPRARAGPSRPSPRAPRRRRCRSSAAYAPSRSRTIVETRLPSARPLTCGITTPMTLPISLAVVGAGRLDRAATIARRAPRRRSARGGRTRSDRRLGALGGGLLGPAAGLEGLGGLDPLLALALEHGDGVARRPPSRPAAASWRSSAGFRRGRARPPSSRCGCRPGLARGSIRSSTKISARRDQTRSTSPSGICRNRVPSSRKLSTSPVQRNRYSPSSAARRLERRGSRGSAAPSAAIA